MRGTDDATGARIPKHGRAPAWVPSETDVRILALVAEGATIDAVARQLALSERTIRRRLAGAASALGVGTTVEVVVHAVRIGLI